jgi:hypothetical protein
VLSKLRTRLTYANVMATVAVFIALGGSSYAAITVTGKNVKNSSLTGKDLKDRSLTGKDIKKSSLTTTEVKDRSLLSKDFKAGQLPAGPQGLKGDTGASATKLFGNFNGSDGSLVKGSGVASSSRATTGTYFIKFDRNVDNCILLASTGSQNSDNPEPRIAGASHINGDPTANAFVLTFQAFTDSRDDADFSLAAFC